MVHMGRVNSIRRMVYAWSIGCTSFDGSKFSRFGDTYIRPTLRVLAALNAGEVHDQSSFLEG
jgi:hypothetical protein